MSKNLNAALAADVVLLADRDGEPHVLLITRLNTPHQGCYALPGGYVDTDEPARTAASRELAEETGIEVREDRLAQVGVYHSPGRDPRGRVVTVAHVATLGHLVAPTAGDDAATATWVPVTEALDANLAFDHHEILRAALDTAGHTVPTP